MIRRTMAVLTLTAMTGGAAFGYDAAAALRAAREGAKEMPFVDKIRVAMGLHVEPGCQKVTFELGAASVSQPFRLWARTWLEDCRPVGSPYGGCIPERRLVRTDEVLATVEVAGRQAADPQEKFLACYYGVQGLSGSVKSSPFKYHRAKEEAGSRLVFRRKN